MMLNHKQFSKGFLGLFFIAFILSAQSCQFYKKVSINPVGENPWENAVAALDIDSSLSITIVHNNSFYELENPHSDGRKIKGTLIPSTSFYMHQPFTRKSYIPISKRKIFTKTLFMTTVLPLEEGNVSFEVNDVFGLTHYERKTKGFQFRPKSIQGKEWKDIFNAAPIEFIRITIGEQEFELHDFDYAGKKIEGRLVKIPKTYSIANNSFKKKLIPKAERSKFESTLFIESHIPLKAGNCSINIKDIKGLTHYKNDRKKNISSNIFSLIGIGTASIVFSIPVIIIVALNNI